MIKQIFIFIITAQMLTSCVSNTNPVAESRDHNKNIIIATPGMDKPINPIPETQWKGDWNNPRDPNYHPQWYNPLEGYWLLTAVNGEPVNRFLAYRFSQNLGIQTLKHKPKPGVEPQFGNIDNDNAEQNDNDPAKSRNGHVYYGLKVHTLKTTSAQKETSELDQSSNTIKYQINDKQLKVHNGSIYNYQVAADRTSMTLNDGTTTYTFGVYDNNGFWYWKGNWNSTLSPYYSIYCGKYNPVQGIWKKISYGNWNQIEDQYYKFYDDYTIGQSQISYGLFAKTANYEINQDGLMEDKHGLTSMSDTHKYWITDDTLFLEPYVNGKLLHNKLAKLIRVQ